MYSNYICKETKMEILTIVNGHFSMYLSKYTYILTPFFLNSRMDVIRHGRESHK